MTILHSREFKEDDYDFLKEIIAKSPNWQEEECFENEIHSYLMSYRMYNGRWEIWIAGDKPVGISYVLEWSPANEKPWVGTILIHPNSRRKGIAKKIIKSIGKELKNKGHKALFVGCSITQDSWLQFLGKCGFEQFKVEKEESTLKEYMISVMPL